MAVAPQSDGEGVRRPIALMASQNQEALLAAIVASSGDAIISADMDGIVRSWNGAAERLFGYGAHEMIGQPVSRLAVDSNASEMPEILDRMRRGGRVEHYETVRRCRDGRIVHLSLSASPVRDAGGDLLGVSTIARDITSRKVAEVVSQEKSRILERIACGAPLQEVLSALCQTGERQLAGATCLVFLADAGGTRLHLAAAPNLLPGCAAELAGGIPITMPSCSCATAACTRAPVFTADIASDPGWAQWRAPLLQWGYRACWSFPILSESNCVLGTFSTWFGEPRSPRADEAGTLRDLLYLASIAVRRANDEEALRASETRFRAVFELAAVGLSTANLQGRYLAVNRKLAGITGYSVEELLTKSYIDVTHPDDRPATRSALLDLFRGRIATLDREKRYLRKDGTTVRVRTTISLVRDDSGRPLYTIAIVEDITAHRNAEQQAHQLASIIEATSDFVAIAGASDGALRYINRAGRLLAGVDPAASLASLRQLLPAAFPGAAISGEGTLQAVDGTAIPVSFVLLTLPADSRGGTPLLATIARDIRDRKAFERSLRESEERYRFLSEAIPQFVWMADAAGQLTYVNAHWHAYTGLDWPQTLERGWTWPLHPDDRDRVLAEVIRSAQDGVPFDTEYRLRRADGEYRWHLARAHRLRQPDGSERWLGTAVDIEERKRSQAALQEERDRLELALAAARMGTWEWDLRTGNVTWSHHMRLLSGFTEDGQFDQTYNTAMNTVHPEDYAAVQAAVDRCVQHNAPYDAEYRHVAADGSIRWIHGKGHIIRDADGAPARLLGVAMDITDRKKAQAEIERATGRLEKTLSSITESFISLDRQWRFLYVNDRVVERTGVGRQDLLGKVITTVFPEFEGTPLWEGYRHVMEHRLPHLFECPDPRASAGAAGRWFEVHAYPTAEGICAYMLDITDRKRAEEALKEREEFYRTLGEAVPDFIWVADGNGGPTYVNQGWQTFTGKSLEDLRRLGWDWFNHPDDVEPLWSRWREAAANGTRFESEFRYRRHDGRYCWYMGRAVPIKGPDGQIRQWVGTSTEIHRLKEAEAALRRYNQQLEEFAFAAAHDLQEPLRNVSIYAEMLMRRVADRLSAQELDFLNLVRGGALRMTSLVRDLLLYTRSLESDGDPRPLDSGEAVRDVIASFTPALKAASADVTMTALPVVRVLPLHLVQLFQNLISNAIKYRSPERPLAIQIRAERRALEWLFTVRDNGIGIHPDYHERVFGLFKRLHGQNIEGTGIGLAIVKRIVDHYGGRLWVESAPDSGAAFRFTLPVADQDDPEI